MKTVKETLEYILSSITNKEDNITVEEHQEGDMNIIEIIAPKEIIGKIIGKEGKIIKSIRTILNLSFHQEKFIVKIRE
ncbi:MAG: KH domain-containing protein [Candidatus Shapirobacteria bacterium]|nr:KH domain-containing protein [Candidatus Shapirobacteria bacterium]